MDEPIKGPVVTLPVAVLRELMKRSDVMEMHVNIPRQCEADFYRAIRLRFALVDAHDPTLYVTEDENGRSVRTVEVRVSTLFELVPRMLQVLGLAEERAEQLRVDDRS